MPETIVPEAKSVLSEAQQLFSHFPAGEGDEPRKHH